MPRIIIISSPSECLRCPKLCGQVLALPLDVVYAIQHMSLVPNPLQECMMLFECPGKVELQQLLVVLLGCLDGAEERRSSQ